MDTQRLHTMTYIPGIAEHARDTNEYIRNNFPDRNFVLAVDLPHGFEQTILSAVKRLPVLSLVLDITGRGIPVIPTHAPIEAVRLYLEYGMDMQFVDSSLPVTGDPGEWYRFAELAQHIGLHEVLAKPENFGLSLEELFGAGDAGSESRPFHFAHLAQRYRSLVSSIPDQEKNRYIDSRNRLMARRLRKLLATGMDVIFVCNERNAQQVIRYLPQETEIPFDDRLVLPSITCSISRASVHKITHEVPYFIYLYDLYRNVEFNRFEYLKKLFSSSRTLEMPGDIEACIRYSLKLALSEGQLYPDVYSLTVAAREIVDDFYAATVLKNALTYDFGREGESDCPGIEGFLDYNLQKVTSRSIELKKQDMWDRDYRRRKTKVRFRSGYSRWIRNSSHYETEKRLVSYLVSHFSFRNERKKFRPKKFCSGLKYGIDFRATLRKSGEGDQLYVREIEKTSKTAYVIDYGGTANSAIFVDRFIEGIGNAQVSGNEYTICTMVLFPVLDCKATDIFIGMQRTRDSLKNAIEIALEHVEQVVVFSDVGEGYLKRLNIPPKKYRLYPLNTIPDHLREPYHRFNTVKNHLQYNPLGD